MVVVKQFNFDALIFLEEVVYSKRLCKIWVQFVPTHFWPVQESPVEFLIIFHTNNSEWVGFTKLVQIN